MPMDLDPKGEDDEGRARQRSSCAGISYNQAHAAALPICPADAGVLSGGHLGAWALPGGRTAVRLLDITPA